MESISKEDGNPEDLRAIILSQQNVIQDKLQVLEYSINLLMKIANTGKFKCESIVIRGKYTYC